VDDWSSVHNRMSCEVVRGVVGNWMCHCMVGNRVGNCMVGNRVGNGMVGNCVVGNCVVGNRMGHCMGDNGVRQEANAMVSWCVVNSWVGHSMMSSMVGNRGSMMNHWSSMVHDRSSMVHHWGSMVHNRGSMVNHWSSMVNHRSSMVDHRSSMVHNRSSMVHNWGSMYHRSCMVHNRGMVNQRCSMHWGLIIVCLSRICHFLDHSVSTVMVSHRLHPAVRQGNRVGARGGVAISRLLLLEVGPAVVVVDPVRVRVRWWLAEVLVGQLGGWGSQAATDKGQQQGHLGGEEGLGGEWVGWKGRKVMTKGKK